MGDSEKCSDGKIRKKGYYRKNYSRQNGTKVKGSYVKSTCIEDRGKPGKGDKILPTPNDDFHFTQYGYSIKKSDKERQKALKLAADDVGIKTAARRLTLIYNLQASDDKNRIVKKKMGKDVSYLWKYFHDSKQKGGDNEKNGELLEKCNEENADLLERCTVAFKMRVGVCEGSKTGTNVPCLFFFISEGRKYRDAYLATVLYKVTKYGYICISKPIISDLLFDLKLVETMFAFIENYFARSNFTRIIFKLNYKTYDEERSKIIMNIMIRRNYYIETLDSKYCELIKTLSLNYD